ncbi:MAG: extracellular solute-binding protein [Clostridiales bacterium]|nr:extracellular solute-binding protein [Clostridiales bacterium]
MKRFKTGTIVMAFLLATSIFAGCGQTATTTTAATTAEATQAAAASTGATAADSTAAAADGSNLVVQLPLTTEKAEFTLFRGLAPFLQPYLKDLNENPTWAELEKRTGVHIKFILMHPAAETEQFNIMIASGDYPDIINNALTLYKGGADKAIEDKVYLRLNELIDTQMPNYKNILSDADKRKIVTTDKCNIAAFANVYDEARAAEAGPMIRQDWLDELGLQTPVTYDDYYNVLKAFKEKKNATAPLMIGANCVPFENYLVEGFGVAGFLMVDGATNSAPFYMDGNTVKFGIIEPAFKEYLTMLNKWYTEGLISKDFTSFTSDLMHPDEQTIINDKAGIWYGESAMMAQYEQKATTAGFKVSPLKDAVKNAGDELKFADVPKTIESPNMAITTACKNPELAAKWFDYLYSEEGSKLCCYGVEGVTYNMVDGKPQYTDLMLKNPDGMVFFQTLERYVMQGGPFVDDLERKRVSDSEQQKASYSAWAKATGGTLKLTLQGNMTTEEGEKYSMLFADISTYISEALPQFVTGKKPLSEFDAFVAQIKTMKIDECIKIKQDAEDRFNSR